MKQPETQYARSGDVHIAYQVFGEGDIDLVYTPGWVSNVELIWEIPQPVEAFERLASFARVILWDKRGTGLSDPVAAPPTLDDRMDDLRAVMDAAGSERAALCGISEGGPTSVLFAATYPERTHSLVLYGTAPRFTAAPGCEWGWTPQQMRERADDITRNWGKGALLDLFIPGAGADPATVELWGRFQRSCASPGMALSLWKSLGAIDTRPILASVRVPTLVLHRTDEIAIPVQGGRMLAAMIPGARLVELPGNIHVPFMSGDTSHMLDVIEEFLTGARHPPDSDRILTTVLFTDIVGSTTRAAELGDRRWNELLERHDTVMRRQLVRYRGTEVNRTGDGFLATFDGPARAVQCAVSAADALRPLALDIRAGVHTGECERRGDALSGLAVHIGARVAAMAGAGEVLVSRTVKDLVVGSDLHFTDRGEHELKGVPDRWHLFAVQA
jgi:class 3 adenylate cyclase/pimeloyl-ACP methyl ester carboxylesterase